MKHRAHLSQGFRFLRLSRRAGPIAAALMLGVAASGMAAQTDGVAATSKEAAAPVRTARLTFFAGSVQIQRTDNSGEDSPALNMPLTQGTRIVSGDYGQVEIEFEDGSVVRMTPRSVVSLDSLALADSVAHTHLTLLSGLAYFELRKAAASTYVVDAGGTEVTPLENLTLRLNLDEPPPIFSVLGGSAHLKRADAYATDLHTGETLRPDAKDPTRYFLTMGVSEESWDEWNRSRDRVAEDDAEKRTTARDGFASGQGYGWSDLDASGSWYDVPGQGQVWQPANADESFDPYGDGAWVWSGAGASGGYVWASGYGWGWTPYRCGQWIFLPGFGWAWKPDGGCGRWGFEGGGGGEVLVFASGGGVRGTGVRRPIARPIADPGNPHAIVPVRGPNGLRPPVLAGGPIKIGGALVERLKPVGSPIPRDETGRRGGSFARDFPVDAKTHQAVLGAVPGLVIASGAATGRSAPPSAARESATESQMRSGRARPVERSPAISSAPSARAPEQAPSPARSAEIARPTAPTHPARGESVAASPAAYRAAPSAPPPAAAPAPQWHSAPPPPPPPAAAPSPSRSEPAVAKPKS